MFVSVFEPEGPLWVKMLDAVGDGADANGATGATSSEMREDDDGATAADVSRRTSIVHRTASACSRVSQRQAAQM